MTSPVKKLFGQTAVYGMSSILGRLLNYLLVPLYTAVFVDPADYGVVSELYAWVAFLIVLLTFGMETAFFRFIQKEGQREKTFATALVSLLFVNAVFFIILAIFHQDIARLLLFEHHGEYILLLGGIVAIFVYGALKKRLRSKLSRLDNTRESVNVLFTVPLIFAASLLSFAHGANDVANAIGPLAAINDAVMTGGISAKAEIPFWVMAVGAFGLAIGLALYGPRLIKTVGSGITDLDPMRAFSVAMAAAITVIIASQLGLPVSSTHIAIGGIFGVGLLREWLDKNSTLEAEIAREKAIVRGEKDRLRALYEQLDEVESRASRTAEDSEEMLRIYKLIDEERAVIKAAKKELKKDQKSLYIKQGMIQKIITAWLITVPSAAVLSACIYYIIQSVMV